MKKLLLIPALLFTLALTGCYEQIPAGHQGKVMGKTGFQPEIYPPSKVWLDEFFTTTPEKMYLVETTTRKYSENVNVKLSEEKLTIALDVNFRGRITSNEKVINSIFNDLKISGNTVTTDEVYEVYGKQLVMNTTRAIVSKYNVDELPKNYERISKEIYTSLLPKLEGLPIELSDITIGQVDYPKVVEESIRLSTQKRMAIEEEEAKVQIKLTEAAGREELAKAEYNIKMMEGKRIRDYNEITSKGITPDLITLRKLELREQELSKWDGKYPTTVMGEAAGVIFSPK